MESSEELQQQEITVLESIYGDDFQICQSTTAWKGATRLHEFNILVKHPEPAHADSIYFHLHTKFPKTYPKLAAATFTVVKPMIGLSPATATKLTSAIHAEAHKYKGIEMVFAIVTYAQEWLGEHVTPVVENPHSLATEALRRTEEEEKAKQQAFEAQLAEQKAREERRTHELQLQINADADKRQAEAAEAARARRPRANTDATEVPDAWGGIDTPTETFTDKIDCDGVIFSTVKLFYPKKDGLMTTYSAEPICDDVRATLPLELVVITFDSKYYSTAAGKKKLRALEPELHRLVSIRHPHLLSLYAIKLTIPIGERNARLALLLDQSPALNLADVLADADSLKEEKATEYLKHILSALQALHSADIMHRGLALEFVGLAPRELGSTTPSTATLNGSFRSHRSQSDDGSPVSSKVVKLGRVAWLTRINTLHRSNPISLDPSIGIHPEPIIREAWQPKEAIESPLLYTKSRDIHCAGFILMQMLLGRDVARRFTDPHSALSIAVISPFLQSFALSLLAQSKKHSFSAAQFLQQLSQPSVRRASRSPALTITPAPHSPQPQSHNVHTPIPRRELDSPPAIRSYFSDAPNNGRHQRLIPAAVPSIFPNFDFRASMRQSRWKEEWEELEVLGRGGFGSVSKARNRIDGRIYAVKRIRLKDVPVPAAGQEPAKRDDNLKLWREVDTLSMLSHRSIVRYYGTWVETTETASAATSEGSSENETDSEDGDEDDEHTADETFTKRGSMSRSMSRSISTRTSASLGLSDPFRHDYGNGGGASVSGRSSFPSMMDIEFVKNDDHSSSGSEDDDDDTDGGVAFEGDSTTPDDDSIGAGVPSPAPARLTRTMYIQMEFVERQTLKERVAEGITEVESWRLFHQILDALVHIGGLGILHRDIKLTNIFIDAQGDCKLGDFGLATSNLELEAAKDQTDPRGLLTKPLRSEPEMTLEVGTRLYIAPEIQRLKGRPRQSDHSKADLYSLGIVFFEMNFKFSTDSERIYVLEALRKPEIIFPTGWDSLRTKQRNIIEWVLQHDPAQRPTALELSQSNLMPARVEDEYFRRALRMMAQPDSPYFQSVMQSVFNQPVRPTRGFLYDMHEDGADHASLNGVVRDKLAEIFRLHGAVDMEPSLLIPVTSTDDEDKVMLLDKHGDPVVLPDNGILPLARLAARKAVTRIKRYHISDVYKPNIGTGHPRVFKSAVYDVITHDLMTGPFAAVAETISVVSRCLEAFPGLDQNCEIRISHAKIQEMVLNRVPAEIRPAIVEILQQSKSSSSQKKALMHKKGLARSVIEELDTVNESDTNIDAIISRIERTSPTLALHVSPFFQEIKETLSYVSVLNVSTPVVIHPLLLGKDTYFKDGVCFEIIRRKKRTDILASGGRYDSLLASLIPPNQKGPENLPVCAVGVQIAVDKIVAALAQFQSTSVKTLVSQQRSFGYWSPRRCDVYVVSYQPGLIQERLEVAALLWQHGISADVMYESGLPDTEQENHLDMCTREGILFTVYPRPRGPRREQLAFKVKSVLKGSEDEVSRQDLVPWLHGQIAEQKRIDATTSGITLNHDVTQSGPAVKDLPMSSDVQLLLPGDAKKQRKQTKQMFMDRAFDAASQLKSAVQSGLPVLAVDVPPSIFDTLTRDSTWIADDDVWRSLLPNFPVGQSAYAQQVRDSAVKRKLDGHAFLLLFAVREEKVGLLTL